MSFWEIIGGIVGFVIGCVLIAAAIDYFEIGSGHWRDDDE